MGDNKLLKEFTRKDVTRLRNIYSGKADEASGIQAGYEKKITEYKEGDVWMENGKEWTIKDGIRQTNTKLTAIKKILSVPFSCPKCKTKMKDKLDPKFYNLFGHCFSCQQSFETQLKIEGKYEDYAQSIMTANALTFTKDARVLLSELAKVDRGIYTETGERQNWSGPAVNKKMLEQAEKEITEIENRINETK